MALSNPKRARDTRHARSSERELLTSTHGTHAAFMVLLRECRASMSAATSKVVIVLASNLIRSNVRSTTRAHTKGRIPRLREVECRCERSQSTSGREDVMRSERNHEHGPRGNDEKGAQKR